MDNPTLLVNFCGEVDDDGEVEDDGGAGDAANDDETGTGAARCDGAAAANDNDETGTGAADCGGCGCCCFCVDDEVTDVVATAST
jgi:hypothetical protein